MNKYLKNNDIVLNVLMVPLGFAWQDETVPGKMHHAYNWPAEFTVSQDGIESYLKKFLTENPDINYIELRSHFEERKNTSNDLLYNEFDGHDVFYQAIRKFLYKIQCNICW